MRRALERDLAAAILCTMLAAAAEAQSTVAIVDGPQPTTTLTAVVSDQARVQLPSGISFNATSVERPIESDAVSVLLDRIVLPTPTAQVRLSVQAAATSFTPPIAGVTTWDAADVSWTAGQWSNAEGGAGTLSPTTYSTIATSHADVSSSSTDGLFFTLAAKPTVTRAGNHTLAIVWKIEAIDP